MTYSKEKFLVFIIGTIILTVVPLFNAGEVTLRLVLVSFVLSCIASFLLTNIIFRFLGKK